MSGSRGFSIYTRRVLPEILSLRTEVESLPSTMSPRSLFLSTTNYLQESLKAMNMEKSSYSVVEAILKECVTLDFFLLGSRLAGIIRLEGSKRGEISILHYNVLSPSHVVKPSIQNIVELGWDSHHMILIFPTYLLTTFYSFP